MAIRTTSVGTQDGSDFLSDAEYNDAAGGWIGRVTRTSDQGGFTSEADLSSLATSPTVGPSRLILVIAKVWVLSTVNNDVARLRLYEDGSQVDSVTWKVNDGLGISKTLVTTLTPSAGTRAYKLTLQRATGAGTLTSTASSLTKAELTVFDMGPA